MDIDGDGDELFGEALNIESNFYSAGYAEGFAHGRQHGTFEGRALGREKAWEVWDELGFYEGFAGVWLRKLQGAGAGSATSRKEAKSLAHAHTLLGLIATFPTTNPTPAGSDAEQRRPEDGDAGEASTTVAAGDMDSPSGLAQAAASVGAGGSSSDPAAGAATPTSGGGASAEIDLAALLSTIRARYRLLCTSVGARPRLVAARDGSSGAAPGAGVVQGIEGPMKGVDTRQLRF